VNTDRTRKRSPRIDNRRIQHGSRLEKRSVRVGVSPTARRRYNVALKLTIGATGGREDLRERRIMALRKITECAARSLA
jgi:hypothetical protein